MFFPFFSVRGLFVCLLSYLKFTRRQSVDEGRGSRVGLGSGNLDDGVDNPGPCPDVVPLSQSLLPSVHVYAALLFEPRDTKKTNLYTTGMNSINSHSHLLHHVIF